jgi:hypothetical protein
MDGDASASLDGRAERIARPMLARTATTAMANVGAWA